MLGCLPRSAELADYSSEWSELAAASGVPQYAGVLPDTSSGGTGAADAGSPFVGSGSAGGTEGTTPLPLSPPESGGTGGTASVTLSEPPAETDESPEASPESACADGVVSADQSTCYRASVVDATWQDARSACLTWQGALVKVESALEDAFVGGLVSTALWLGGSDTDVENVYVWTDGSPITFGNWGVGQPDAFPGPDCIEKRKTPGELWYDLPCYNLRAYVCEKPLD